VYARRAMNRPRWKRSRSTRHDHRRDLHIISANREELLIAPVGSLLAANQTLGHAGRRLPESCALSPRRPSRRCRSADARSASERPSPCLGNKEVLRQAREKTAKLRRRRRVAAEHGGADELPLPPKSWSALSMRSRKDSCSAFLTPDLVGDEVFHALLSCWPQNEGARAREARSRPLKRVQKKTVAARRLLSWEFFVILSGARNHLGWSRVALDSSLAQNDKKLWGRGQRKLWSTLKQVWLDSLFRVDLPRTRGHLPT